jgi:integrase
VASIAKRPDGRWRARYRDEAGREHSKHFTRKIDAQKWLDEITTALVSGTYVDPAAGKISFRENAEYWRLHQVHEATTAAQVETHLRRHVYPPLGDLPLGAIRRSNVRHLIKGMERGVDGRRPLAPSTIRVIYTWVVAIFSAAVLDKKIPSSPCVKITLPRPDGNPEVAIPTTEQVIALIQAAPPWYTALLTTAAGSGLRQGEVLGLELGHIDFLRRTIKVEQQLATLAGAPPFIKRPKTEASFRTVPVGPVVLDALAAHLAAYPLAEVEIRRGGTDGELSAARLVFTNSRGEPIRRSNFNRKVWHPTLKRAGLADVDFRHLRHYYASLLIAYGEDVVTVSHWLGHRSTEETHQTYLHLWLNREDWSRAAVEQALGQPLQDRADLVRTGGAC